MSPILYWLLTTLAAAAVFFITRYVQMRTGYNALSRPEQRRVEVEAARTAARKVKLREKIRTELTKLGLGQDMAPFYIGAVLIYLAVAAPLTLLGVPDDLGLAAAAPLSVLAGFGVVRYRAARRRAQFNRQLIDLLDQLVSQIRGGTSIERSLDIIVPQMPDPLREEMTAVLARVGTGTDLTTEIRRLKVVYPSRAIDLFCAALELNASAGQEIAPALSQAAELLKQQFALGDEANAELAQIRYEFYAVGAIIVGLGVYLVAGGTPETRAAYFTFAGIIALCICVGNIALGFFRFNRMLNKAKGDT